MRYYILLITLIFTSQLLNAQFEVTATVTDIACFNQGGGSIDLEVDMGCEPYTYVWSINGNVISTDQDIFDLGIGTYTVTVGDCNGAGGEYSYVISVAPELLIETETSAGCIDNVSVTGGCPPYLYSWGNATPITSFPHCGLPMQYGLLYITDDCGCTVWDTLYLGNQLAITDSNVIDPGCLNDTDGSIDITVSGGIPPYSYTWSNGETVEDIENLFEGIYTVSVSDNAGNLLVQTYELIYNPQTDLAIASATIVDLSCENINGSISLEITGGCAPYSFEWSNNSTEPMISVNAPGTYSVTILDCTGCGVIEEFTILPPESFSIDVLTSPGCIDEIIINGTCSVFEFTVGGLDLGPLPICNLAPGVYEIEVTEACTGCQAIEIVIIEEEPIIVSIDTLIYPSCNGAADGAINISVTGGTPGYTFAWSNGAATEDINNLTAGEYTVTVQDAEGFIAVTNVFLSEAPYFLDDYSIGCESVNGNDGSIELVTNPYGAPYTYFWSNGSNDQNQYGLPSGLYSVTVISAQGCEIFPEPYFVCHDSMQLNLDTLVCAGTEVLLDVHFDDNIDFLGWANPADNEIECDTCPVTSVFPHETRTYTAEYSSPIYGPFDYSFTIEVIPGCVWPGDTDSSTVVDLFDLFPILLEYGTTGPARSNQDIDWYGHMAPDYGINMAINNIDAKHADSNGDGIIDLIDAVAIVANWGETHKSLSGGEKNGVPVYVEQDTVYEAGATLSLPVIVGNMDSMASDIYAIGFSIFFDPEIMVNESASLVITDSWFSDGSVPMGIVQKEFAEAGRLDVALGRTDLSNVSGNGQIANFIITMEDDILKADPNREFEFTIDHIRMINVQGKEIETQGLTTTSLLVDSTSVGVQDLAELNKRLFIFPNPTLSDSEIQIVTSLNVESFQLLNLNGQRLQTGKIRKGKNGIQLDEQLSSGLYIMQIDGDFGRLTQKLIVK